MIMAAFKYKCQPLHSMLKPNGEEEMYKKFLICLISNSLDLVKGCIIRA